MIHATDHAWSAHTCGQSLARAATRWPDQQALLIDGESRTYSQLLNDVQQTATGLRRLGLKRGDHFAICMGNTREWCTLFLAAGTIGAVTVPINTRFKADEIAYCLRQADVRMLAIADRFLSIDFIAMLRSVVPGLDSALPDPAFPLLSTIIVAGHNVPAGCRPLETLTRLDGQEVAPTATDPVQPDDTLLIQYTSGTTAYPKGRCCHTPACCATPLKWAVASTFGLATAISAVVRCFTRRAPPCRFSAPSRRAPAI